jgi:hypothetical protein
MLKYSKNVAYYSLFSSREPGFGFSDLEFYFADIALSAVSISRRRIALIRDW